MTTINIHLTFDFFFCHFSTSTRHFASFHPLACVVTVPVRRERNSGRAKDFFAFGPRENWGESKKLEGWGGGRGRKGTLARNPLDSEKRPSTFHG